jgi:hypothetical protein
MRRTAVAADSTAYHRPEAGVLVKGEVFLNDSAVEPGLYFKTEENKLVKVGPCHVGAYPPNYKPPTISTASGFVSSKELSKGELWLDKTLEKPVLKVYDGFEWVEINGSNQIKKDLIERGNITVEGQAVYKSNVLFEQPVFSLQEDELAVDNRLVTAKYVLGKLKELKEELKKELIEELKEEIKEEIKEEKVSIAKRKRSSSAKDIRSDVVVIADES